MDKPKVSVIMSIYNEKLCWIQKSIESILNQTYKEFEFIIVVDNPLINEEVMIYLLSLKKSDTRVIIIKNEINIGLAACLNKAIDIANGEYIARMDADDISFEDRFEKQIKFIEETESDMVSGLRINIDEEGNILDKVEKNKLDPIVYLPKSNYIVHPSVLMKRDKLIKLGGYRNFSKSQDYDLWLRMISSGYKISIMDDYVIWYRIRSNSISVANKLEQYYISEYQKKLYLERKKYGKDSFCEEHLNNYIMSKKITVKKNERYSKSREYMDDAIVYFKNRQISFFKYFIISIFLFPRIAYNTIEIYLLYMKK